MAEDNPDNIHNLSTSKRQDWVDELIDLTDSQVQANLRGTLGMAVSMEELGHKALLNKKMAFITNLKPVTMMGIESTAMIMPGEIEKGFVITMQGQIGTSLL